MSKRHLARDVKRVKLVEQYKERRDALRKAQIDMNLSDEERLAARMKLNSLPRDSSKVRETIRCSATGTSHSVYRKFGLNRISFRNMALKGLLPGVTKSSW